MANLALDSGSHQDLGLRPDEVRDTCRRPVRRRPETARSEICVSGRRSIRQDKAGVRQQARGANRHAVVHARILVTLEMTVLPWKHGGLSARRLVDQHQPVLEELRRQCALARRNLVEQRLTRLDCVCSLAASA